MHRTTEKMRWWDEVLLLLKANCWDAAKRDQSMTMRWGSRVSWTTAVCMQICPPAPADPVIPVHAHRCCAPAARPPFTRRLPAPAARPAADSAAATAPMSSCTVWFTAATRWRSRMNVPTILRVRRARETWCMMFAVQAFLCMSVCWIRCQPGMALGLTCRWA